MGQHKTNPVAQAAKRGELSKADRVRPPSIGSRFGGMVSSARYVTNARGEVRRKFPKVKGKANAKRAKQARRLAREFAVRSAEAQS